MPLALYPNVYVLLPIDAPLGTYPEFFRCLYNDRACLYRDLLSSWLRMPRALNGVQRKLP